MSKFVVILKCVIAIICAPLLALIVVTHSSQEPKENYWLGRFALWLGIYDD